MRKKAFTLLELMLALALLLFAAGAISWNIHQAVKKYRFHSEISRLKTQLQSCRRLALNTSTDWKFSLTIHPTSVQTQALPLRGSPAPLKPLSLSPLHILFNNQEFEQLSIYFSPTGRIEPDGILEISSPPYLETISLSDLFRTQELPDKQGPTHPDDLPSSS